MVVEREVERGMLNTAITLPVVSTLGEAWPLLGCGMSARDKFTIDNRQITPMLDLVSDNRTCQIALITFEYGW